MSTPKKTSLLHPRYWAGWLAFGLLRLAILLPYSAQLRVGRGLGRLMQKLAGRRQRVAEYNLRTCFPEWSEEKRQQLIREHFEALGIAMFEIGMCWWASDRRLRKLVQIEGLEHLDAALEKGKGAILLSAHFTTLEIGGRLLSLYRPFHLMYRPNRNELLEYISKNRREAHFEKAIPRDAVRELLKSLKQNRTVWYAPDQGYQGANSVTVPFFGVPAPTNPATHRLARISGATVMPFWVERLPGKAGYKLRIDPPIEGMADMSPEEDGATVNCLIEAEARKVPEQYLWTHNRFKTTEHRKHEKPRKRKKD
ncbi:LpxL/LpxP family Kdo(2)-lipid IV(A) lauroyl/palmitoleoyl acyltransferase [Natronospira bacteriovora]|uniref:Lipid A biosynthesis acyltransferase n=1 Tax=Natronospira bacteriovora TaxID=3069753 RepID=A0ABU0W9F0_9GAMM|nr:LpxL/LpxP family Kdo(2)-lipid IV(A) lauroyl/palmitoleoyl acyltransferase [Natronospira sp. AB-CW4]MDQ2069615.1 LpxL/LpxP family Kdo(2)-lipid IV(A) lauroyl/palmitoleoyl acyltransferase [Natronospira sp. AB-CW4]